MIESLSRRVIRRSRLAVGAGAIILALCAGTVSSLTASAAVIACRTDPVVTLSNGASIAMTASVNDTASDITGESYVLHVPRGLSVESTSYDGMLPETATVYADNPSHTYTESMTVSTRTYRVSVTGTISLTRNYRTATNQETGNSNRSVSLSLTPSFA